MSSNPPSVTLYVSNLNDKLVKKPEMRRTLYSLFSLYGKVMDVVHTRQGRQSGTAFIVYKDLSSANSAMRALDGEGFYGKQLRISFAKSTSHATIAAQEGPEAVYAIKLGLQTAADKKKSGLQSKLTVSNAQRKQIDQANKAKRSRPGQGDDDDDDEEEEEGDDEEEGDASGEPSRKKGKKNVESDDDDDDAMEEDDSDDEQQAAAVAAKAAASAPAVPAPGDQPTNILFLEGLPLDLTSDMLLPLFQQYPGLSSLKLLPASANKTNTSGAGLTAFVQYETVAQATTAKDALDDFKLAPQVVMRVSWAKRG